MDDQSINQSINQSVNRSINRFIYSSTTTDLSNNYELDRFVGHAEEGVCPLVGVESPQGGRVVGQLRPPAKLGLVLALLLQLHGMTRTMMMVMIT